MSMDRGLNTRAPANPRRAGRMLDIFSPPPRPPRPPRPGTSSSFTISGFQPIKPPAPIAQISASPAETMAIAPISRGSDNTGNIQTETRAKPLDWRDSAYNSQIAALNRALQDFETGAQTRGQRYGQDFTTGLGRMGFRPAEGFQAAPDIEALTQPQTAARGLSAGGEQGVSVPPGQWDIEGEFDRTSAAARGTRGMRDEFAGRGTLRSSDFAKSFGDFQNRLGQQLEAMETGRTRFGEDLATELGQFRTRTQEQRSAAEAAAQNRAIMQAISSRGF